MDCWVSPTEHRATAAFAAMRVASEPLLPFDGTSDDIAFLEAVEALRRAGGDQERELGVTEEARRMCEEGVWHKDTPAADIFLLSAQTSQCDCCIIPCVSVQLKGIRKRLLKEAQEAVTHNFVHCFTFST